MKRNIIILIIAISGILPISAAVVHAATASDVDKVNISDPEFQLSICDGPRPPNTPANSTTVYCDFDGLILTVRRFINVMIVIGVIAAFGSFCYIGYLYITGTQENIKKAKSILPKIFFGFIIMLSAWFIVYQMLTWLGASPGFKALLGSPK